MAESDQTSQPADLSGSLRRNIDALAEHRRRHVASAGAQQRLAVRISGFIGSMWFVYLHLTLFGVWIMASEGALPGMGRFDPSFNVLSMAASVEAIFLSTFVLISQNHNATLADARADLDLHISLLAEHELTRLTEVVTAIADHLEVTHAATDIDEVKMHISPEAVLGALDAKRHQT